MEKRKSNRLGSENYILRLYRRQPDAGEQDVIGLLEDPLHGKQWSFRTMEELKRLLQVETETEETQAGDI